MIDPTGHWFAEALSTIWAIASAEPTIFGEAVALVATLVLGITYICTYTPPAKSIPSSSTSIPAPKPSSVPSKVGKDTTGGDVALPAPGYRPTVASK